MRFLDDLEIYLTEGKKEIYDLYPVDYDAESGVSFAVNQGDVDDEKPVAKVVIKTADGTPIDALSGNYGYEDVYVDVNMHGDTDDPAKVQLMAWLIRKLKRLGYDDNTIRIDGKEVFRKTRDLEKEEGEGADSDELDFTKYWNNDKDEDDDTESETPIFEPVSGGEGGESETDTETTSKEDDEEDDFTKKFSKKKFKKK